MKAAANLLEQEHTPEAIRARLAAVRRPSLTRDAILGATDGCVTTFAVVAGAVGGELSHQVVVILGFANLVADGFSMAASNYLGTKAVNEELEKAIAAETKHIEEIPEGEREEIRQIFSAKGFAGDLLEKVVAVIVGNRQLWVNTMITDELGLQPRDAKPARAALATFTAFGLAGLIPMLPFLAPKTAMNFGFTLSCVTTAATFFLIGLLKGIFLSQPLWKSSWSTALLGGTAAALAFATGFFLNWIGAQ